MFRDSITSTPFTSLSAGRIFENITGSSFDSDISFLSTMRALLYPRMESGDSVQLNMTSVGYAVSGTYTNNGADAVRVMLGYHDMPANSVIIRDFSHLGSTVQAEWMQTVDENFCKAFPGFSRLEKVTDFFRKTFMVICYINPEIRTAVLIVDKLTKQTHHYLQCGILAFMPWYFDPEKGVSEDEMELIKSLREKSSSKYKACLEKMAEKYDFRSENIKILLEGFEHSYEKTQYETVKNDIGYMLSQIENLYKSIAQYNKQCEELNIKLLGLASKINSDNSQDSELMEYFICNKNLIVNNTNQSKLTFVAKTYIEYYDEDVARSVIDNPRSYVYKPGGRNCSSIISAKDMKMLMSAIFIEQTLKAKFCAAYTLDIVGCSMTPLSRFVYNYECDEYQPNTHIDRFACPGNYRSIVGELLKENDYIMAVEQCIASCKSLNFGDQCVMEEFMLRMYGIGDSVNRRFIELPTGETVTPQNAIAWLNSHKSISEEESSDEQNN